MSAVMCWNTSKAKTEIKQSAPNADITHWTHIWDQGFAEESFGEQIDVTSTHHKAQLVPWSVVFRWHLEAKQCNFQFVLCPFFPTGMSVPLKVEWQAKNKQEMDLPPLRWATLLIEFLLVYNSEYHRGSATQCGQPCLWGSFVPFTGLTLYKWCVFQKPGYRENQYFFFLI